MHKVTTAFAGAYFLSSFLWLCRPASACCSRVPPRVAPDLSLPLSLLLELALFVLAEPDLPGDPDEVGLFPDEDLLVPELG